MLTRPLWWPFPHRVGVFNLARESSACCGPFPGAQCQAAPALVRAGPSTTRCCRCAKRGAPDFRAPLDFSLCGRGLGGPLCDQAIKLLDGPDVDPKCLTLVHAPVPIEVVPITKYGLADLLPWKQVEVSEP